MYVVEAVTPIAPSARVELLARLAPAGVTSALILGRTALVHWGRSDMEFGSYATAEVLRALVGERSFGRVVLVGAPSRIRRAFAMVDGGHDITVVLTGGRPSRPAVAMRAVAA